MTTTTQLRSWWAPPCEGARTTVALNGKGTVSVRVDIVDAVHALNRCLTTFGYETRAEDTGAYNCREITSADPADHKWSLHAYAIALDLNWTTNPYGPVLDTDMPAGMIEAVKAIRTNTGRQVWRWGGDYAGNKDAMHFEVCCSPADIASGIDPDTVPGGAHPTPPSEEDLMIQIEWFKGEPTAPGDQADVTAAYRVVYAKAGKNLTAFEAFHVRNPSELKTLTGHGYPDVGIAKARAITAVVPYIKFHDGPFKNV